MKLNSNPVNKLTYVKCPTCQQKVLWNEASTFRPFCSKRCQLIDLGEWADEQHRIPSEDLIAENEVWSDEE